MLNRLFKKTFEPTTGNLQVGSRTVPLLLVHHPRARRYLLRLRPAERWLKQNAKLLR